MAAPIRIDDSGQLLAQHEGKTHGAGLLLEVLDAGSHLRLVPLISQDSSGRNHQLVIPFNIPVTLVLHTMFYHISDAKGLPLSQGATIKIPLLVASGQQISPIKFQVTGAGK